MMETIDQLSTYIHVYVADYSNDIYVKGIMILFVYGIEFFANLRQEFNLQLASTSTSIRVSLVAGLRLKPREIHAITSQNYHNMTHW